MSKKLSNSKVSSKKKDILLKTHYNNDYHNTNLLEIGIDEAGRGPMFGRVYSAAVILPKDDSFDHSQMKDSKKFSSEKKIKIVSDYIKKNAVKWSIGYATEQEIDNINIRNATHLAMHRAIKQIILNENNEKQCEKQCETQNEEYFILVDGRDFKPFTIVNDNIINEVPNVCIEGGDNKYSSIAAASILAKVARDEYIKDLCDTNDKLDIRYGILKNKGYGTSQHMIGIKTYGISENHRKTFGICSNYC